MRRDDQTYAVAERIMAYIDSRLYDRVTAADIARAAGYSQHHAARIFKEHTGESPFEYLRQRRLVESARRLRDTQATVLSIAMDYVFDSHEGFTRAFANAFGITPKRFASLPSPVGWRIPYHYLDRRNKSREAKAMEKTAVIFTQIMERPARKLILKRSRSATHYFEYCEELGCGESGASAPWDILCGVREALYEPVGLWLPPNMRPEGTGIYAHGVEVAADYTGGIPEGFDVIELAPCKLLVFQGEPYDDEHFMDAVGICMERIDTYKPEVYGYSYAPELAPRLQLAPQGWRGYIELRPVRELVRA